MWPFKKNPYKCRYIELYYTKYATDKAVVYSHNFTNKLRIDSSKVFEVDDYQAFDLDDTSSLNKLVRINYGYKKKNKNVPYLPFDVVALCVDIHNKRGLKNNGKS